MATRSEALKLATQIIGLVTPILRPKFNVWEWRIENVRETNYLQLVRDRPYSSEKYIIAERPILYEWNYVSECPAAYRELMWCANNGLFDRMKDWFASQQELFVNIKLPEAPPKQSIFHKVCNFF
jgi:hypothetical protein